MCAEYVKWGSLQLQLKLFISELCTRCAGASANSYSPGADEPQSSARRECFIKFVTRVRSVSHNLNRLLQGPGRVHRII